MEKIKSFFRFVFVYKELRECQAHATKLQIFKFWCRNGLRRVSMAVMVLILGAGSAFIYREVNPKTVWAERQVLTDSLELRIEGLKKDVISHLASCETQGLKEDDGIIVFDTNNKASIGVLQFQKKTVVYYYKVLYDQVITSKQAVEIALDAKKSAQLAEDIIFGTKDGLSNWINCDRKLGLALEVSFIKKISQ